MTALPDRRLSMHLMAQPDVAAGWLTDPVLMDQGLLARVLASAPESTAGTRLWRDWEDNGAVAEYHQRLYTTMRQPLPIDQASGGIRPRVLSLSPAARRIWIRFYNATEMCVRPGGEFDAIRGLGNKLAEHAARLAAVLAMAGDGSAAVIDAEAMESGVELARHYAAEALRLVQGTTVNDQLKLAQKTLTCEHEHFV